MRPSALAGLALLCLAAVPATSPTTYPIRQFRPSHVGDVFDLDATAAQRRRVTTTLGNGPPVVRDDGRTVHLVGRCTVRDVDAAGAYTTLDCRIDRLTVAAPGGPDADVLPAGVVVQATRPAGSSQYRLLDGPLPPGADRVLALVLTAYTPGGPTPDDVYPAGRPRAVGESWPMDAARDPAGRRAAAGTHAAGHATLVGLTRLTGRPCLWVKHVEDHDGPVAPPAQPAGVRSAHRNDLLVSTATLPLDPAVMAVDVALLDTVDYDYQGATPDGTPFDQGVHVVTDTHLARTPAGR